jgi:hypothetical protein
MGCVCVRRFLSRVANKDVCNIKIDGAELVLWKRAISACVERCREWDYRFSCDCKSGTQIPLSLERGENPLCSCAEGSLSAKYISDIPNWGTVSKYAVRAAISPCFSIPYVEEVFGVVAKMKPTEPEHQQCKACGRGKPLKGTNLFRRGRCHETQYCSVECQRGDWKTYKKFCTRREYHPERF